MGSHVMGFPDFGALLARATTWEGGGAPPLWLLLSLDHCVSALLETGKDCLDSDQLWH